MKALKNYLALVAALESGKLESNAQLNYLFKTMNNGAPEQVEQLQNLLNNSEGIALAPEQVQKGFDWLKNLWVSPTGKERKNNPFGYREQDALGNPGTIELSGYYNAGNRYRDFFVPLYDVSGKSKTGESFYGFQYYVSGGEIHIVG